MVVMAYGPYGIFQSTGPPSSNILQRHLCTDPLPALVQKIWLPGWCILGLAREKHHRKPEGHGMIMGNILP